MKRFATLLTVVFAIACTAQAQTTEDSVKAVINRLFEGMKNADTITPIRLQAYERMTLFLERITPSNLLIRVSGSGQTATDYHRMLINDIRNEYNHNLSQQIYMTEHTWEKIQSAKENVVTLINRSFHEMPDKSKGTDLAKRVLETIIAQETDPTEQAIRLMKREINEVF